MPFPSIPSLPQACLNAMIHSMASLFQVGRKRRTRWPLCFTDIVGLFCKCKKMKQICRLLQLSEMGKRLRQGKDTSRTY
ncbi:unnamed protein product [Triticum turgidum subsp. durum]|uniref:Uncharacterized protein n=1 Tax=Triticum turgidum subsp. durum TaxID=4567 RepID=A0A9R0V6T4_TRITD|nr:unnamed protein product [Triticum turgidum subsp. durum]